MEMKGRVMACPVLTIPMKDNFKSVMLTQCVKCQNIEFEWFWVDKMVEWTIEREYGTGIFKAECKERGIIITKNTYNEARVEMLEVKKPSWKNGIVIEMY